MIKLEKVETLLLTRELAVKHSTMTALDGERELQQRHIEALEQRLRLGEFTEPDWIVARVRKTGKLYRVDGQHSSTMLARCAAELFPAGIEVVVKTYGIDDVTADAGTLWDMVNSPISVRSNADKMTFFRAQHKEMLSIPSRFLMKAANGYHLYLKSVEAKNNKKPRTWDSRNHGQYLADTPFRAFVPWLYRWQQQWEESHDVPNRWVFSQPGVVAVMFEGWRGDAKFATEFWGYFLMDNHPQRNDVTRDLSRILNKWHSGSEKRSQAMYHRQAMTAWLAAWKKRSGGKG